jgi:hypothetical protein
LPAIIASPQSMKLRSGSSVEHVFIQNKGLSLSVERGMGLA